MRFAAGLIVWDRPCTPSLSAKIRVHPEPSVETDGAGLRYNCRGLFCPGTGDFSRLHPAPEPHREARHETRFRRKSYQNWLVGIVGRRRSWHHAIDRRKVNLHHSNNESLDNLDIQKYTSNIAFLIVTDNELTSQASNFWNSDITKISTVRSEAYNYCTELHYISCSFLQK